MTEDAFAHRARTLEDRFFAEKDANLLEKLRQRHYEEITIDELGAASGISDRVLLANLAKFKINPQTLAALSVIPLVEVAWADGAVAPEEREAVLKAAIESGIPKDGPGYRQLENWLTTRPDETLLAAWKDYLAALAEKLGAQDYRSVGDKLIANAKGVARAAGGYLGFGSISPSEQKVLDQLAAAFHH